ncbi:MAG: tyrosine--tRNA ligase [bacterium]
MNKIEEILTRGVTDVIVKEDLEKVLKSDKKLRIKLGIDPTGPKLHIGRAISLWKLREFQDLGHQIVLIIGDFTAQTGDASDKTAERQILTPEVIAKNMNTYKQQIGMILDMDNVEIRYNSEWWGKMSAGELLQEAANFTVNQLIKRDNFWQRWENDKPIGLHEILYPLQQGYDSVAIKADVEIGGNDQLFNLLAGRTMQKKYGQKEQNVITFELLEGTDGRKMSTSYDNCIYIEDEPNEMFGKIMSIKDELILRYLKLVTDIPIGEVEMIKLDLENGMNPRDAKVILGKALVSRYHGVEKAEEASQHFQQVFVNKEKPTAIEEIEILKKKWQLAELLHFAGLVSSKTDGRRIIEQGGVKVDGAVIGDREATVNSTSGMVIQVGKRKFIKIK